MPVSKANQRAVNKYVKNNYDRINVTMPKGKRDIIQTAASGNNLSVNAYINQAIDERMERDNGGGTDSRANAAQDAAESVSGVGATPIQPEPNAPTDHAQTLAEAKRIVWAAGDVILPSLLRESVAEASRAAGETDDAFLWRAVSSQAEQDREKRKAAANAADAPQGILIPVVVSLPLDALERVEAAAEAAGESVTAFLARTAELASRTKPKRKGAR